MIWFHFYKKINYEHITWQEIEEQREKDKQNWLDFFNNSKVCRLTTVGYLAFALVKDKEKLQIGFLLLFAIIAS